MLTALKFKHTVMHLLGNIKLFLLKLSREDSTLQDNCRASSVARERKEGTEGPQ